MTNFQVQPWLNKINREHIRRSASEAARKVLHRESGISIQTRGMVRMEEEKPLSNQEEKKEKDENSLLNYEYDEDDDGVDWEV